MNYYLKALQNYANFNGRARRSEYWYFFLFNVLISFAMGVIDLMISLPILGNIYSLVILIPAIAVGVRRMHDVGKSGWFLLVPIYNIVLAATEGDRGDNAYGSDPKAGVM